MKNNSKRWVSRYKSIFKDTMSGIGILWMFVKILSYSTSGGTDSFTKSIEFFLISFVLILIAALIKNKPKSSFFYKLRDKDNLIEVKIGDAFMNEGAVIIPMNDHFDVSLGGNVKKAKSLQNTLIRRFYAGKENHLSQDISKKIDISSPHKIGTTIEIEQGKKTFYLLVNSRKKENNRVESKIDDFLLCLSKVWDYVAQESGRNDTLTIPLISTNHGRIANLNRMNAIKEIIYNYIESSKFLNIADKLIISIYKEDIKKGDINLDEVEEYLRFNCKHYRKIDFSSKPEGKEISASITAKISN